MPYLFGTGWEHGNLIFPTVVNTPSDKVEIRTNNQRTGARSLYVVTAYPAAQITTWAFAWGGTASELYLTVGVKPIASQYRVSRVGFILTDGKYVEIRLANGAAWAAYVDGTLVQTGSIVPNSDVYHVLELRVKVADSPDGIIQARVDGVLDIDYSGEGADTKPSAATVLDRVLLATERTEWQSGYGNITTHFDDFTLKDDGWPGGISYDLLVPTADTADKDFLRSTGDDNYALVDEVPASAVDYVYTDTGAQKDLYAVGDWVGTDKTPRLLMQWMSGWKAEASADQLKMVVKSGATENVGPAIDLTTSMVNYWRTILADPNGDVEWTDAAIDALTAGFESVAN